MLKQNRFINASRASFYFRLIVCICFMHSSRADDFVEWQSSNLQLLRGWNYEVGEDQRTIATFEYANRWRYGDFFMFVDATRFDGGETTAYGEVSPRVSISKLFSTNLSYGLLRDVLISATMEKGKGDIRAYLMGIAVDLNMPGFTFFKTNYYLRRNPDLDDTWQITLAWQYPFQVGAIHVMTEGFADFAGDADPSYHKNQYIVPRVLVDVSALFNVNENRLWLGVEYSYWRNKYGIQGITESNPQLQLKFNF